MTVKPNFVRWKLKFHLTKIFFKKKILLCLILLLSFQFLSPISSLIGSYFFQEIRIENFWIELSAILIVLLSLTYICISDIKIYYTKLDIYILSFAVYFIVSNLRFEGETDIYFFVLITIFFLQLFFLQILEPYKLYLTSTIRFISSVVAVYVIIQNLMYTSSIIESDLLKDIFNDNTTLGNFLTLTFPYLLFTSRDKPIKRQRILLIINFLAIFLSKDVSSIILTLILIYIFYSFFNERTKILLNFKKNWYYHLLFISISIVIGAGVLVNTKKALRALEGRVFIQKNSIPMLKENLFFGIGQGKFSASYNLLQAEYFFNEKDVKKYNENRNLANNSFSCFNEYLQLSIECGILGLIFLSTVIYIIYRNIIHVPITPAIISFSLFLLLSLNDNLFHNFSIVPILIINIRLLNNSHKKYFFRARTLKFWSFTLILFTLFNAWYIVKRFNSMLKFEKALGYVSNSLKLQLYEMAFEDLKYDGFFLYKYGHFLVRKQFHLNESIRILELSVTRLPHTDILNLLGDSYLLNNDYIKAEQCYITSSNIVPIKITPKYKLFKLYLLKGERFKALKQAQLINGTPIKIFSKAGNDIRIEISLYLSNAN